MRLQAAMQSLSKLAIGESPRSTLSPRSPPEATRSGVPAAAAAAAQASAATAAHGEAAVGSTPTARQVHKVRWT